MSSRYQKVETRFWHDEHVSAMSPTDKLLFLYLLTCPSSNAIGLFVVRPETVSADTGYSLDTVSKRYRAGILDSAIRYDAGISLFWIVKKLQFDPPQNEKHAKGLIAYLDALPKSQIVLDFLQYYQDDTLFDTSGGRAFSALCRYRIETVSKRYRAGIPPNPIPNPIPIPIPTTLAAASEWSIAAMDVVDHLNSVTGAKFKVASKEIEARLKDHSVADLCRMIDYRWSLARSEKDRSFVNQVTPFRETNWNSWWPQAEKFVQPHRRYSADKSAPSAGELFATTSDDDVDAIMGGGQ